MKYVDCDSIFDSHLADHFLSHAILCDPDNRSDFVSEILNLAEVAE